MVSDEIDRETFFGNEYLTQHTVENHVESVQTYDREDCKPEDFSSCIKSFVLSPYWGIWTSLHLPVSIS